MTDHLQSRLRSNHRVPRSHPDTLESDRVEAQPEPALAAGFWHDETGMLCTVDYLVLVTVVCVGMIVGLVELRNSYVQVMGDIAGALESLDQSYSSTVAGVTSAYVDTLPAADVAGVEPQGISVQEAAASE